MIDTIRNTPNGGNATYRLRQDGEAFGPQIPNLRMAQRLARFMQMCLDEGVRLTLPSDDGRIVPGMGLSGAVPEDFPGVDDIVQDD